MSKLTSELKREHQEITKILLNLQQFGCTSPRGMELLKKSKSLLIAHLNKEDKQLYPPLYRKAQSDFALRRTLDIFGQETEKITGFIDLFYQKYTAVNHPNRDELVKDMAIFIVELKDRMMKEEIAIYKAYDRLELG